VHPVGGGFLYEKFSRHDSNGDALIFLIAPVSWLSLLTAVVFWRDSQLTRLALAMMNYQSYNMNNSSCGQVSFDHKWQRRKGT
jgi:hypothetical protein